jgi:GMP synthase-like glutamine amidotransferase
MDPMQVLVIQNDLNSPVSLLGDYLQAAGAKLTTLLPHNGDKLPATPEGFDGAIILGGPQHAHDDARFPAFLPMLDLLRAFHEQTKPLLGMCLGGQLMARAFGEKVRVNDAFEFGFLPIEITPEGREDPLLAGLAPRQRIMQWHEDTFGLPEGGVRLMTGTTCLNQAFRFGKTAYGFQCHWEVSMELARDWVENFGHVLQTKLGEAKATETVTRAKGEFEKYGRRANDFCRVVTQRWADLVTAAKQGLVEKTGERAA